MSSIDIKTTMNVTYGIMTMIYLLSIGVMNTLSIRIYQEDVIIPYKTAKKAAEKAAEVVQTKVVETAAAPETAAAAADTFTDIKENFGQEELQELQTEMKETSVVDKNAVVIVEAIMMAITIPLAFGYIIGFDCSCPTDGNDKHVGKIIFCFGVFIPMVYIIVSEIVSLLIPDKDWLNPFLPPNSSKEAQDKHFFNRQYRKTFCWCLITLTFIIHFFSVAFGSNSSSGGVNMEVY